MIPPLVVGGKTYYQGTAFTVTDKGEYIGNIHTEDIATSCRGQKVPCTMVHQQVANRWHKMELLRSCLAWGFVPIP